MSTTSPTKMDSINEIFFSDFDETKSVDDDVVHDVCKLLAAGPHITPQRAIHRTIDQEASRWRSSRVTLMTNRDAVHASRGGLSAECRDRVKLTSNGDCRAGTRDPSVFPSDVMNGVEIHNRIEYVAVDDASVTTLKSEFADMRERIATHLRARLHASGNSESMTTAIIAYPLVGNMVKIDFDGVTRRIYNMPDAAVTCVFHIRKMVTRAFNYTIFDPEMRTRRERTKVAHVVYLGCTLTTDVVTPETLAVEIEPEHATAADDDDDDKTRRLDFFVQRDRTRRQFNR